MLIEPISGGVHSVPTSKTPPILRMNLRNNAIFSMLRGSSCDRVHFCTRDGVYTLRTRLWVIFRVIVQFRQIKKH